MPSLPSGSSTSFAAWLVDLDGTLYRHNFVRALMAAELALGNWNHIGLLRRFRLEQELMRGEPHCGSLDLFALQIRQVAQRLGRDVRDVEQIVVHWMIKRPCKWIRLFRRKDLLREIEVFRSQGGRTALVSDYPAADKLAALGGSQLFDTIIANGECRPALPLKPAPEGLLLAAEQLGFAPHQCLVIGDRPTVDGEAARRAGMAFHLVGKCRK